MRDARHSFAGVGGPIYIGRPPCIITNNISIINSYQNTERGRKKKKKKKTAASKLADRQVAERKEEKKVGEQDRHHCAPAPRPTPRYCAVTTGWALFQLINSNDESALHPGCVSLCPRLYVFCTLCDIVADERARSKNSPSPSTRPKMLLGKNNQRLH